MLKLNLEHANIDNQEILSYQEEVNKCHKLLKEKAGKGNDYLGWLDWPIDYDKDEVQKIVDLAAKMKGKYDTIIVCSIGGSYLGARAAIEMIRGLYPSDGIEVLFTGNTISAKTISQLLNKIKDKNVVLNVISKSGTTTETALAFRLFKKAMENKYGKEAKERIFATTDKNKGTLKEIATKEGYATFVIPDDIGGRYSVSTAVGLLPMALCGIDVKEVLKGSCDAYHDYASSDLNTNDAYRYGVARRILNKRGLDSEMYITYEPQYNMISEWLKQLFGESEGKEGKGLLPTSACFTTDLHSLGQYIQEGHRCFFETILHILDSEEDIIFPYDESNDDHMNYLADKKVSWVNEKAFEGTLKAHSEIGGVSSILIDIDKSDAYNFGYMIYFFFLACGMSCYLLDINPFNQPGVEVYKKNMFSLLGKE